jgi:exodeoxyribonuclease VII large subunit
LVKKIVWIDIKPPVDYPNGMNQLGLFRQKTLSVSEINHYLKELMESDEILRDIWISGEISTLSRPGSGHIYFTLKDVNASLRCVIWKMNAMRLQLALQTGMAIEAHGSISIYERDGQMQLYVDAIRLAGEGELYQEFLRLKAKLEAEGLFALERKRSLPTRPETIGIVTSPTGAALQDILNTLHKRYPIVQVVISPASVQGIEAPTEIVDALDLLNSAIKPDLIIVARGGGSLEDLWAFNDENVVRAIASSPVPIVTGIGHETDFTLADFTADLRAPTPTGAAVASTPDISDLKIEVTDLGGRLVRGFMDKLENSQRDISEWEQRLLHATPAWKIQNERQANDTISSRMNLQILHWLSIKQSVLDNFGLRLTTLDPQAILQRGFALVNKSDGSRVHSVNQVVKNDELGITVSDGEFHATVRES